MSVPRLTTTAGIPFTAAPMIPKGMGAATLTGNTSLVRLNRRFLQLDPGGASRDVTMPAGVDGDMWLIYNSANAAEDLVLKDPDANTLATVGQGKSAILGFDDGTYRVFLAT